MKAPGSEFPPLGLVIARFGRAVWQMDQFQSEALSAFTKSAQLESGIVDAIGAALRDEPRPTYSGIDDRDLIEVDMNRDEAERVLEWSELSRDNSAEHFPLILGEMCLVALFARYDAFVSDLLRCVFRRRPELLKSGKRITFSSVLDASSLEELKEELVDREVQDWRVPLKKQFEQFRNRFGIELRLTEAQVSEVVDASERRNVIVHRGGRIDWRYLREVPNSDLVEGESLAVNDVYVEEVGGKLTGLAFQITTEISEHCLDESFELSDELIEAAM